MNETIKHQLDHRTIRFFKDQRVPEEQMEAILNVFQRTATSVAMQAVSIIRVEDQTKKEAIAEVGNQPYIAKAPELFILIIDLYRNYTIAKEKGYEGDGPGMNSFFQASADAHLAAQNMVNAAESLGLGTNYLGNVLNNPSKMVEILDLPKYTFPILGLSMGIVDDEPELKPRMSNDLRVFKDSYQRFDSYLDEISEYDKEIVHYYDTRKKNQRSDTFSNQVVGTFEKRNDIREHILDSIEKQGFDLKR